MKLLCIKCGEVETTLTPIEEGEPMQCPKCLDFTVEAIEDEPAKNVVKIFTGTTSLRDYSEHDINWE